jgi:signal transduction histidine kinase
MRLRTVLGIAGIVAAVNVAVVLVVSLGPGLGRAGKEPRTGPPPAAAQHLADALASAAFRAAITVDYATLNAIVRQAASWSEVVYVSVEDGGGKILAHTDPRRVGQVWSDELAAEIRADTSRPHHEVISARSDSTGAATSRPAVARVRLGYVDTSVPARPVPPVPLWVLVAVAAGAAIPAGALAAGLVRTDGPDSPRSGDDEPKDSETTAALRKTLTERTRMLADVRFAHDETIARQARLMPHIAHVFRSSLTTVLGFSKVLLGGGDGSLTEAQAADVRSIEASGRQLLTFVNTLADLGRAQAGTIERNPGPIAVETTCREVASDPGVAAAVDVMIDCDPNLPAVRADRQQLRQILGTLLRHGLALPGHGALALSARSRDEHVVLEITYPGRTLSDDELATFFEPWPDLDVLPRVDPQIARLRLALAHALAAANGAALSADRTSDGVRVILTMPAMAAVDTTVDQPSHPEPEAAPR